MVSFCKQSFWRSSVSLCHQILFPQRKDCLSPLWPCASAKTRNFTNSKEKFQSPPLPKAKPLSHLKDNFLDGTSSVYLEELQRMWEKDPNSVDESWKIFFQNFTGQSLGSTRTSTSPALSIGDHSIQESLRVLSLVRAYQVNGHMKAKLDPLGLDNRKKPPELELAAYDFTEKDLDKQMFLGVWQISGLLAENKLQSLRDIVQRLEKAYCGTTGYEYMHIADREKCNWLRERIETSTPKKYSADRKAQILDRLLWSTNFENFLAQKWTAAKRFGLEGCETLIPGRDYFLMYTRNLQHKLMLI